MLHHDSLYDFSFAMELKTWRNEQTKHAFEAGKRDHYDEQWAVDGIIIYDNSKEKKTVAFPTPPTLSWKLSAGCQWLPNGFDHLTQNR